MKKYSALVLAALVGLLLLPTPPAAAIVGGAPDRGEHPFVGELLFFVPNEVDPRFDDPGAWFTCSGTLIDADTVVTAGHCTYDVGVDGVAAEDPLFGGNDVWFSVSEEPDFDILDPSTDFVPDRNAERYQQWSTALDASSDWAEAESTFTHPEFEPATFFEHDLGVLELSEPIELDEYGTLPGLDYLEASGRGTATLAPDTTRAARRAMPVGGYVSARRSRGTTEADLRQITAAGAQLTGRMRIADGGRLEGELHASAPDLARTAAEAETFLARGSLLPAPVSGATIVDARLGGTVDAPSADVSVSSRSVSIGAASGGATIFLVPAKNCADVMLDADRRGRVHGMQTVRVTKLQDAITALEALAKDPDARVPACEAAD